MTEPPWDWDQSYTREEPAPWDIGRPQPGFVHLAEQGLLSGRLLDAGCGTGENALMAAAHGAHVTGIDLSRRAIETARAKAAERDIGATFEVADALNLGTLRTAFDTIIDSGLFHVLGDEDRARYVASLATALKTGGTLYLMCFSDRQPGDWGPRRVHQEELRSAFSDGWTIHSITADEFDINPGLGALTVQAWRAAIARL
jgi:cyclopropane fatty-acyl-phospholipid synthase-like methyltransferase